MDWSAAGYPPAASRSLYEHKGILMMYTQSPAEKSGLVYNIALMLAIGLVIFSVLSVFLFTANAVLLQPQTYKNALLRGGFYTFLPALTAEQLTAGSDGCEQNACTLDTALSMANFLGIPADYLYNLDRGSWEAIFGVLMSADWAQTQTESVVDQLFNDLQTGQPASAQISIDSRRSQLGDDDYRVITERVLSSAPVCSPDQMLSLAVIQMGASSAAAPFCVPTEEFRPLLESQLNAVLRDLVWRLPPEVTLNAAAFAGITRQNGQPDSGEASDTPALGHFQRVRLIFMLSPLAVLFLLGLTLLTAVRNWQDTGRWLGIPLLVAGLLVMAASAGLLLATPWLVSNLFLSQLTVTPSTSIVQMIENLARAAAQRYVFWNAIGAGALFVSGAALMLISQFTRPRQGQSVYVNDYSSRY
jgi:hypothetical protein